MSMSLDGYVANSNSGVAKVFDWYFISVDVELHTGGADPMTFKLFQESAEYIRSRSSKLGALLKGRNTFEVAQGWGGNHAWGPVRCQVFLAVIVTNHPTSEKPKRKKYTD